MKYFAALAALVAAVQAASLGNTNYDTIAAGQSFTITWYDASGSVTVDLRNGLSTDLKQLQTIVAGSTSTDGTGSFTWTVPSTLTAAGPYAFVITDSAGVNYSPQFPISGVTVGGGETTTKADATTTADATTVTTSAKTTISANNMPTITSVPMATATHSFESDQTSSSFAASSSLVHKTTMSTKVHSTGSQVTTVPTTVPGESKAVGMASPLALVLVSLATMFFLQ